MASFASSVEVPTRGESCRLGSTGKRCKQQHTADTVVLRVDTDEPFECESTKKAVAAWSDMLHNKFDSVDSQTGFADKRTVAYILQSLIKPDEHMRILELQLVPLLALLWHAVPPSLVLLDYPPASTLASQSLI